MKRKAMAARPGRCPFMADQYEDVAAAFEVAVARER